MRIDVKNVRNKQYIQFVDKNGHLYHIGSATDFDSWIIALFVWYQQWEEEADERRKRFFNEIAGKIGAYVQLDDEKTAIIDALSYQLDTLTQRRRRREMRFSDNSGARGVFSNALRTRLEPRLREIYYKRRKFEREMDNFKTYDSAKVSKQKELPYFLEQYRNEILMELTPTKNQNRNVNRWKIATKIAMRHETSPALVEFCIEQLLRSGKIYEPREGYLRKV